MGRGPQTCLFFVFSCFCWRRGGGGLAISILSIPPLHFFFFGWVFLQIRPAAAPYPIPPLFLLRWGVGTSFTNACVKLVHSNGRFSICNNLSQNQPKSTLHQPTAAPASHQQPLFAQERYGRLRHMDPEFSTKEAPLWACLRMVGVCGSGGGGGGDGDGGGILGVVLGSKQPLTYFWLGKALSDSAILRFRGVIAFVSSAIHVLVPGLSLGFHSG